MKRVKFLHAESPKSLQGMKFGGETTFGKLKVPRDVTQTVSEVSMGEGQEKVARDKNHAAFITGGWLILQNCHLGIDYMNEVEDTVGNITTQHLGSQLKSNANCRALRGDLDQNTWDPSRSLE